MEFREKYWFLSNFYPVPIKAFGQTYDNAESAYQACKCAIEADRALFLHLTGGQAKRLGRTIPIRMDWNAKRVGFMLVILRRKFRPEHVQLRNWLLATGDEEIVEDNTWNDRFWGVCNGSGENHMGKLLMRVRADIKNGVTWEDSK